jgi:hypothetical protein
VLHDHETSVFIVAQRCHHRDKPLHAR